jgi:hypothetical protein
MKRREQLVCQHLEKISRKALEEYQDILRQFVKRRHGIYALYRKNQLYYVGLASDLKFRLNHHLKDRHANAWDHFSIYLTLEPSHLRELEALAIRIANPKGNQQKGRFKRSQNLMATFKKMMQGRFKELLCDLLGHERNKIKKASSPQKINGRKPALAGYFPLGQKLRMRYKEKEYRAYIKRNGYLRFNGKDYSSPSSAAKAVTKTSMDGWHWWKYERAPGEWVFLDELRK